MEPAIELKRIREAVRQALEGFESDPADNDFQLGYQAALHWLRDEVLS